MRAVIYAIIGLGVMFSAELHEQFLFDRWVAAASLALIGAALFFEFLIGRRQEQIVGQGSLAAALIAIAAAVALMFTTESVAFALVIAVWAAVIALLTLFGEVTSWRAHLPQVAVHSLLAVAVLLVRDDEVAIIGFFGAYAIIAAVFYAISIFDQGSGSQAQAARSVAHTESAS